MSIFDLFSGSNGRKSALFAAQKAADDAAAQRAAEASQAFTNQYLLNQGSEKAAKEIQSAQPQELDALRNGFDQARAGYGNAAAIFDPWVKRGNAAGDMESNALGVNGQGGFDTANDAWKNYAVMNKGVVDQALDDASRHAAASGNLLSGNAAVALSDRARDLQNANYGQWANALHGVSGMGLSAAGQQAGYMGRGADLWAQQGQGEAGIYGNDARSLAGLYNGAAKDDVSQQNQLWQTAWNNITRDNQRAADAGSNAFTAGTDASKNAWNAGLAGANTVASLWGAGNGKASIGGGGSNSAGSLGGSLRSFWDGLSNPNYNANASDWT